MLKFVKERINTQIAIAKLCEQSECHLCDNNKCMGNGLCYYPSPSNDSFVRHKCEYHCVLYACPRCQTTCTKWHLEENNGFCVICSFKLGLIYDSSGTKQEFLKRMLKLYINENIMNEK